MEVNLSDEHNNILPYFVISQLFMQQSRSQSPNRTYKYTEKDCDLIIAIEILITEIVMLYPLEI